MPGPIQERRKIQVSGARQLRAIRPHFLEVVQRRTRIPRHREDRRYLGTREIKLLYSVVLGRPRILALAVTVSSVVRPQPTPETQVETYLEQIRPVPQVLEVDFLVLRPTIQVDRREDYLEVLILVQLGDFLDQVPIPSNQRVMLQRIYLEIQARTSLVRSLQGQVFLAQLPRIHYLEAGSSNSSNSSSSSSSSHRYLEPIHFLEAQTRLIPVKD
jgi:hypothetical protein